MTTQGSECSVLAWQRGRMNAVRNSECLPIRCAVLLCALFEALYHREWGRNKSRISKR